MRVSEVGVVLGVDGLCCMCVEKKAATNDGRFCRSCLRRRIREENPETWDHGPRGWGRGRGTTGNLDPFALGGAPREMTDDREE